jgi:hypothetical protein
MKLKMILENMDKMPSTLKGFNDTPKLSPEEKKKLMEMVRNYNSLGEKLRMENSLIETATSLAEISRLAEIYACNESNDWFATEVVKGDFKRAKGISESFQKLAKECHGKVQQLNALYEDMGKVLERYYEIADPTMEVNTNPNNVKGQRGLPNAKPQTIMQEVKPNNSNIKSQRDLTSGGPAPKQFKESAVATGKCGWCGGNHDTAECPGAKGGQPWKRPTSVNETSPNSSNIKSQRDLASGGPTSCHCPKPENPSIPVKPAGSGEMNVKGERDVPQGGPGSYTYRKS